MPLHTCGGQNTAFRVSSFPPPWESPGSKSSHSAWKRVHLPAAEPFHQPTANSHLMKSKRRIKTRTIREVKQGGSLVADRISSEGQGKEGQFYKINMNKCITLGFPFYRQ